MDEIEVRELRYFIAVAQELNFTRAARRLGIAQPPLSAAIAKLERKIGVSLFERSSRSVTLTPAGAVLLEQGRIAVEGVAAAVERTRRTAAHAERLTVAVKAGGSTSLLREIVRRCSQDPKMPEVHVLFGHYGEQAAALRGGTADVGLLRAPFDARGLDTEVLLVEPRVVALAADHRLAGRRELRRAELAGERMPRWELHEDVGQLLDAAALGQSLAFLPQSAVRQYNRPDLVFVPVPDFGPSTLVAAWPDSSRSLAVAAFVETAADTVREWSAGEPELSIGN